MLIFILKAYSQDYIKNDTINYLGNKYDVTHVSYGKTSLTKIAKVFVNNSQNHKTIVSEIVSCTNKNKSEFTEYYIMTIKNKKIDIIKFKKIVSYYLKKIDSERMKNNLSTLQVKCNYEYSNNKFKYILNEPLEKLEKIKNLYLKISTESICNKIKS